MKAVLIPVAGEPRLAELDGLADYQREVGGWLEAVTLDDETLLIVNEEGKLKGLRPNPIATRLCGRDRIVGPAFVTGRKGEDFADVAPYWALRVGAEWPIANRGTFAEDLARYLDERIGDGRLTIDEIVEVNLYNRNGIVVEPSYAGELGVAARPTLVRIRSYIR